MEMMVEMICLKKKIEKIINFYFMEWKKMKSDKDLFEDLFEV